MMPICNSKFRTRPEIRDRTEMGVGRAYLHLHIRHPSNNTALYRLPNARHTHSITTIQIDIILHVYVWTPITQKCATDGRGFITHTYDSLNYHTSAFLIYFLVGGRSVCGTKIKLFCCGKIHTLLWIPLE